MNILLNLTCIILFLSPLQGALLDAEKEYDCKYKVILLGDSQVGKTSIIRQLQGERFENALPNTAVETTDYLVELCDEEMQLGDKKIQLHLCDTGGQEQYANIIRFYYKHVDGIILCYDITKLATLQSCLDRWAGEIDDNCNTIPALILCGTKYDEEAKRQVQQKDVENMVGKLKQTGLFRCITTFETSAKVNYNLNQLINAVAGILLNYELILYPSGLCLRAGDEVEVETPEGNQRAIVEAALPNKVKVQLCNKPAKLTIPVPDIVKVVKKACYKERPANNNIRLVQKVPQEKKGGMSWWNCSIL